MDKTGLLTWNDIFGGVSLIAGIVLEFVPGMQWLGTSLIVAGFSHFAYTISSVQDKKMSWNDASNMAGFTFSTTITINKPTNKEKNSSTNTTSAGGSGSVAFNDTKENKKERFDKNNPKQTYTSVGAKGQIIGDPQVNYGGVKGLTINKYYGYYQNGSGGVVLDLQYTNQNIGNPQWAQFIKTDYPAEGLTSPYWDCDYNCPYYYTAIEMNEHTINNSYSFYDNPSRPCANCSWSASLFLLTPNGKALTLYYGFIVNNRITYTLPLIVGYPKMP